MTSTTRNGKLCVYGWRQHNAVRQETLAVKLIDEIPHQHDGSIPQLKKMLHTTLLLGEGRNGG